MKAYWPSKVRIVEVGPRDGLQNEARILPLEVKGHYIQKLIEAGLSHIEVTSFVRPDRIKQMSDAHELYPIVHSQRQKAQLICLVPNLKGLEKAASLGVSEIAVFTATSETFNQKNINASIDESLKRIDEVCKEALRLGIKIRAYVSTVFGCPYEGKSSDYILKKVMERLLAFGAYEISLGDTIGIAHPGQVFDLLKELEGFCDRSQLAMHFHDTRGLALCNILTSLEQGITVFDSSTGGVGGCPYALGATGNVATEDVVYLLHSMGIQTGLNLDKIIEASLYILNALERSSSSKYLTSVIKAREAGK